MQHLPPSSWSFSATAPLFLLFLKKNVSGSFYSIYSSPCDSPLLNSFYSSHHCTPPSHPQNVIGVKWLQIPEPTYAATHITACHLLATTQWLPLSKTKTTRSPFKPGLQQRGDSRRLRGFESETWLKTTVKNHNTVVNVNMGQRVNRLGKPCSDGSLRHYLVKHILCSNEHNPGLSKGTYPNLPQSSTVADCVEVYRVLPANIKTAETAAALAANGWFEDQIWRNRAVENDIFFHTFMGFPLRKKTLNCRVQRPRSSLSGCWGVLF